MAQMVKNLRVIREIQVRSLGQEDPLEKGMATYSSILSGEFLGQKSLAGYSTWSCKEPDATERLTLLISRNILNLLIIYAIIIS